MDQYIGFETTQNCSREPWCYQDGILKEDEILQCYLRFSLEYKSIYIWCNRGKSGSRLKYPQGKKLLVSEYSLQFTQLMSDFGLESRASYGVK